MSVRCVPSQGTQHLLNLHGNGTLMTMPEDDKMMMSLESRYHSLEFDYAPTPEQVSGWVGQHHPRAPRAYTERGKGV